MEVKLEEQILQKLDRMLSLIEGSSRDHGLTQEWLNGDQVQKVLGISKRTLQKYRDTGDVQFSQFGRKILYPKQSVLSFLKKYSNPEFNVPGILTSKTKGGRYER